MSPSQDSEPATERGLRSSSARNPRRRQRASDGESLKTAPRRKRSKLSADTFAPTRDGDDGNGSAAVANGGIHQTEARRASTPATDMDLPVRGKKSSVKRTLKGDGAKLLTQNTAYSVKLLPSTPRELCREGLEYRGSVGAGHHALAVTRERAYIWDYAAHAPVVNARRFDLPFPVRADDPLPFGALVTSSATADIGLALVSATSGKIVFYESIERAASLGLFQERMVGVEGTLTLFSGETIVDITSADHAGFVLTLSNGRVVQLILRDAHGKARIFTQSLRTNDSGAGGFFGSIKGLLNAGAWRKEVAAVHTRSLGTRGQMQAVALTERSEIQIWDLDWSGQYEFKGSFDFREVLVNELKALEPAETQSRTESITALDFAILDRATRARGDEVATVGAEQPLEFWLLFSAGATENHHYALAEIALTGQTVTVSRTLELETYGGQNGPGRTRKPRLFLPKPGHTGYVVFEDATVLFATAELTIDGPDAQLRASLQDVRPFEDTSYLRTDKRLAIMAASAEDTKSGHASCVAFVNGAGLVRYSATDPTGNIERSRIPTKSSIEQAVFYGMNEDNILDFARKTHTAYSIQEVEAAALEISSEILCSTTPYIPASTASIELNLGVRAKALRILVAYAVHNYAPLSKRAMWQLLCDAEMIAAGQEMWSAFERHKAAHEKRTSTALDELCAFAQKRFQWASFEAAGAEELVRMVFLHGLPHLGELLPLARNILEQLRQDSSAPVAKVVRFVQEADDLWIRAMETVFAFRSENAAMYGIPPESLPDGVLVDTAQLAELPEFWTSTEPMLKSVRHVAELSRAMANAAFQPDQSRLTEEIAKKISSENPRLVQLCCLIYQERIHWLQSRGSASSRAMAERLQTNYGETRYDQIRELQAIGQAEAAMRLAEKYRDMHTLTMVVVSESQFYVEEMQRTASSEEKQGCVEQLDDLSQRITRYFDKFGDAWANAFFDEAFSSSRAGLMLDEAQLNWSQPLTKYLRADQSRAKLCWINDIAAAKDFAHAGISLAEAGREQETRLWAKRVELSMSKLALMANQEGLREAGVEATASDPPPSLPALDLVIVDVQERLFQHILSETISAIDREVQLNIITEKFCQGESKIPALKGLLGVNIEQVLDHLVLSLEDLIDVLTLMNSIVYEEGDEAEGNLQGSEFYLALTALNAAAPSLPPERFDILLRLIWRRCYIHDDWIHLNKHLTSQSTTEDGIRTALNNTSTWRTIYHLQNDAQLAGPESNIRIVPPSECLGAACSRGDWAYRFPDDNLLVPIVNDNQIQDEMLAGFINDRQLEQWVERCVLDVRERAEQDAEQQAGRLERERELETRLAGQDQAGGSNDAQDNINGHLNGAKAERGGGDTGLLVGDFIQERGMA